MARAALSLSNGDLARRAGVGVNTVSRFELGQDVRLSSVLAIRAALEACGAVFVQAGQTASVDAVGVGLTEGR
jgi:predicted transcriptional regulator